jgi:HK97 family phage portal protein
MRLFGKRTEAEAKSVDQMPEWVWDQLQANGLMSDASGVEKAVGLPAILAVIRLISHAVGQVPLMVLQGSDVDPDLREQARDSWQWRLLHTRPGPPPSTAFNLKADLAANFAGRGNAYVRKIKPLGQAAPGRPRIIELMSENAGKIKPQRVNGLVVFEDNTGDRTVTRGTDEIIQFRSFSLSDGLEGVAPITAARLMISAGLKRMEFEERHLANGIFPSLGIKFASNIDAEAAQRWIDLIESRHQGTGRAGKVIAVGGGAEQLVPIPLSLEDAQFAELTQLTLEQACAIYQVPISFFRGAPNEAEWRFFVTFALGPIFTALEQGFTADDDLFDPYTEADLICEAFPDALLKTDIRNRYDAYRFARQGGWITANEIRRKENLPAVDGGDVIQVTPVGGAPNPSDTAEADTGNDPSVGTAPAPDGGTTP